MKARYQQLAEHPQSHFCVSSYCLRERVNKRTGATEMACRFEAPWEACPSTRLQFTETKTGRVRARIQTKRNDDRLNAHHPTALRYWGGNLDFQVVLDMDEACAYMTKYATKGKLPTT